MIDETEDLMREAGYEVDIFEASYSEDYNQDILSTTLFEFILIGYSYNGNKFRLKHKLPEREPNYDTVVAKELSAKMIEQIKNP